MSCPFYKFESSGWFGGDYYCIKEKKAVGSDIYYKYCRDYDYKECPIYKHDSSSAGCFLTTACTVARNLPDDCRELTILRAFRDNWLKNQPNGVHLIAHYYEIAPKIVEAINNQPDRLVIWDEVYQKHVLPCVNMIDENRCLEALELYQKMTEELERRYC